MATKKTTTATKTAPAKNTSAKKPAAKKQPPPKTVKATTAKKPAATKTTDKKMLQIDAALAVLKKARKPMFCKEMVEAMVIGKIVGLLDTPDIKGQIESAIARRLKASTTKPRDTKSLRQRIAELDKNISKGAERLQLLGGADLDDASRTLSNWRAQRHSLEKQLQAFQPDPTGLPRARDWPRRGRTELLAGSSPSPNHGRYGPPWRS